MKSREDPGKACNDPFVLTEEEEEEKKEIFVAQLNNYIFARKRSIVL